MKENLEIEMENSEFEWDERPGGTILLSLVHPFFPSKWDLANATAEDARACRETTRTRGREKAGEGEKNVITAGEW